MKKIILILLDGVGYDAGVRNAGFLEAKVQQGLARRWKMQVPLPSLSLPLYETIHTGLLPTEHGIYSNDIVEPSQQNHIFKQLVAHNKKTAAVAHSCFYQLYCSFAYDAIKHAYYDDTSKAIQHGRFYSLDRYNKVNLCLPAEIDLCAQANQMIDQYMPDYLLLHTCSTDSIGHAYGGESVEYFEQISIIDNALSRCLDSWLVKGYEIIVTADHGMNVHGMHGGSDESVLAVPFYYFGDSQNIGAESDVLSQTVICDFMLSRILNKPNDNNG